MTRIVFLIESPSHSMHSELEQWAYEHPTLLGESTVDNRHYVSYVKYSGSRARYEPCTCWKATRYLSVNLSLLQEGEGPMLLRKAKKLAAKYGTACRGVIKQTEERVVTYTVETL